MPIWTGDNDLDDDYPPLNRNDVLKIRALLLKIEEAGGINVLTDDEIETLRSVVHVFNLPGVHDMLIAESSRHQASIYWRKIRARWWRFIAWLSGIFAAIAVFISQIDDAVKAVRGWFQ